MSPSSVFQVPQTIWKYNALFHLASENSTGTTPPPITGQLLVDIFLLKEEEKALKIEEEVICLYRKEYNILDIYHQSLGNERRMGRKKEIRHNFYSFIRQTWLQKI